MISNAQKTLAGRYMRRFANRGRAVDNDARQSFERILPRTMTMVVRLERSFLCSSTTCRPRLQDESACRSRNFSTKTQTATIKSQLRSLIKPFLLKCHPDVQPNAFSKKINLEATQNLNSYLDIIDTLLSGGKSYDTKRASRIIEIDFCIQADLSDKGYTTKQKKEAAKRSSRRKLELLLPPIALCKALISGVPSFGDRRALCDHTTQEIAKLLTLAGLEAPASPLDEMDYILEQELGVSDDGTGMRRKETSGPGSDSRGFRRSHFDYQKHSDRARYERSRDAFTSRIQWQHYDRLYAQAVAELEADRVIDDLAKRDPGFRHRIIAKILSNIRLDTTPRERPRTPASMESDSSTAEDTNSITMRDQLIAFRRLSLLFDANFFDLKIGEFGRMWDTCRIVLTPPRLYNTSGSALSKRKAKLGETGFSFTLHPDASVTIIVPIDFTDDELLHELDTTLWDFYKFIGDGTEELYGAPPRVAF